MCAKGHTLKACVQCPALVFDHFLRSTFTWEKEMYTTCGIFSLLVLSVLCTSSALELQVVTVATEETDGFRRFMQSARHFNLSVEVVGMGIEWRGGDVARYPGGGFKVNLIRPVLEKWRHREDLVIMFVDSYDVIFAAGQEAILQKFKEFDCKIVFSAEGFCWPDATLATSYPKVGLGKRFLCSGGFVGYAPTVNAVVSDYTLGDTDDDQLYYTHIYLDETKRDQYGMRLDHRSHMFQNLNGAQDEVEIVFNNGHTTATNTLYNTNAAVYHGNGGSKLFLNYLSNYIPDRWTQDGGCTWCKEEMVKLAENKDQWPHVLLALFVEQPTPFLPQMLEKLVALDYPKTHISLWVHNKVEYHETVVGNWTGQQHSLYKSVHYTNSNQSVSEPDARQQAISACINVSCDYLFMVDSVSHFDQIDTLQRLVSLNRTVLVPMMLRPYTLWSTFWGNIAANGFYARSDDYNDLVSYKRIGVWNVPFISSAILIQGQWLRELWKRQDMPQYHSHIYESDMAFCQWMRDRGHFMYVSNLHHYGHLVNPTNYDTNHLHNDLYSLFDNRKDWEDKYLHPDYSQNLNETAEVASPCTDVYWFPLLSETYAKEMIEELENYGQWSSGNHEDERLDGGYENVPTRDIHMTQVGFNNHWINIIKTYIVPVNNRVYPGYFAKGNGALNFVVKYHPQGQPLLRPHHDASTWTINVALTRPGVDHEGGGCRFIRQNCSVVNTRLGWALMHPGRLTHYHEGLPVTKGTRYIMVSFIDP